MALRYAKSKSALLLRSRRIGLVVPETCTMTPVFPGDEPRLASSASRRCNCTVCAQRPVA
eukprot:2679093-Prymnesium_polylepis.2